MSEKLKIYACSGLGVGETAETKNFNYWTDGTQTLNNTQAANTLLAKINLALAELRCLKTLTDDERVKLINAINLYSVCLYFVRKYDSHYTQLEKAGRAIGALVAEGEFDHQITIENAENEANKAIARVNEIIENGEQTAEPDITFMTWWDDTIVARNTYGFDREQRDAIAQAVAAVKGVGVVDENWKNNEDIAQYLTKGSEYFLYLYFTDAQLAKLPRAFRVKAQKQMATYNYCKDVFVGLYGSEQDMQDIIRAGIIGYFGETPEEVCDEIASGKREGVGVLGPAEIVSIVTAILTFVATIITSLCSAVAQIKQAQYAAIDQEAINASVPSGEDYEGIDYSSLNSTDTNKLITWAAIGTGLLLLLRK